MLRIKLLLGSLEFFLRRNEERFAEDVDVFELESASQGTARIEVHGQASLDSLDRADIQSGNRGQLLLRPMPHLTRKANERRQLFSGQQTGFGGLICAAHFGAPVLSTNVAKYEELGATPTRQDPDSRLTVFSRSGCKDSAGVAD
ncbi:hypothetical protein FQZ97_996580 [compost metagenome]